MFCVQMTTLEVSTPKASPSLLRAEGPRRGAGANGWRLPSLPTPWEQVRGLGERGKEIGKKKWGRDYTVTTSFFP